MRPSVQKQRADGYYPVYIRVTHERRTAFIKTNKVVDSKSVNKNKEIRDNAVLKYCMELISYYTQRLNMQDISKWSIKEVVAFLATEETDAPTVGTMSTSSRKTVDKLTVNAARASKPGSVSTELKLMGGSPSN